MRSRQTVLGAALVAVLIVAALLLQQVLATVFFAITVAYVLVPPYQWLRRRGLPAWWAGAVTTAGAFVATVVVLLPIAVVVYLRRRQLVALVESIPDRIVLDALDFTYVVDIGDATALLVDHVVRAAVGYASAMPVIGIKATVFAFVVFALLVRGHEVGRAVLGPIPREFHDVATAIHDRVRGTLFALYVIQAATALATFAVALPVFAAFGYRYPIALAAVAGVLQFLPIVGPSLLVLAMAAFEASVAAYPRAAAIAVVGLVVIGFLPDAVLRPRLARETARLPASLYFVGFSGGLLSLGPVGIIAGPLIVAILAEVLSLLADERTAATVGDLEP